MKRAQSAMEMAIIITFLMLGFALFLVFFNVKLVDIEKKNNYDLLLDLGEVVKSEVEMGVMVESGYTRSFFLPSDLSGNTYNLSFRNGSTLGTDYSVFVLGYDDIEISPMNFVFFLPPNITGYFLYGVDNQIIKDGGRVCINTCA